VGRFALDPQRHIFKMLGACSTQMWELCLSYLRLSRSAVQRCPSVGVLQIFFANVGTLNLQDRDQPNSPDTDKSDSLAHSSKRERTCADTVGTVLVPWAGHFEC